MDGNSSRYTSERYPLLGYQPPDPPSSPSYLRKGLAGIFLILLLGAATLIILDPSAHDADHAGQRNKLLKEYGPLMSGSGQQPQQPQQKQDDWFRKALKKEYDAFEGKEGHDSETNDDEFNESSDKIKHVDRQQQQENASAILESVSRLLDTVGKNFIPIKDIGKIMEMDLKKVHEKMSENKTTAAGTLKSGKEGGNTTRELMQKMKLELNQMKEKLQYGLDHYMDRMVDQKVEKDIGRIIDHMKEGGCPLYGVFSMINIVADMLSEGGYEILDNKSDITDPNTPIDFSFPSAVKHRLKQLALKNATVQAGRLKKFYGLPPESIMNAYMPSSVVDTLMEKNVNKTTAAGKLKASASETTASSSTGIAKDWGSFGMKIQDEFQKINLKHMKTAN